MSDRRLSRQVRLLSVRSIAHVAVALIVLLGLSLSSCKTDEAKTTRTTLASSEAADPNDDSLVAPEIVQVEKVTVQNGVRYVTVSNTRGAYGLACSAEQDSCLSLAQGTDYLLFDQRTKWKFPGAKDYVTLAWLQDWSGKYNNQPDNVGLIPATERSPIGMYWLESWSKK